MTDEYQYRMPPEMKGRLAILVRLMFEQFYLDLTAALMPLSITPKQWAILCVASSRRLNQHCIATELSLNRNSLVTMLDELQNLGLVVREQNPENRREYHIVVTKAGKKVMSEAGTIIKRIEMTYLAPLSKDEQSELVSNLTSLVEMHQPQR